MNVSLIAALSENRVIGKDNDLVWHLPDDLQYFKEKTMGHHVLMGRKNFESIPPKYRPLKGRENLVITRNTDYQADGAMVFNNLKDAIHYAEKNGEQELYIIGGAEIYNQTIDVADTLYLTWVHHQFEGDAYFPEIDNAEWEVTWEKKHATDKRHKYPFTFMTYQRILGR